jgi:hypothetical protein
MSSRNRASRASSGSKRVRFFGSTNDTAAASSLKTVGRPLLPKPVRPKQVAELNASVRQEISSKSSASIQIIYNPCLLARDLRMLDVAEASSCTRTPNSGFDMLEVLEGTVLLEPSHAGGEFEGLSLLENDASKSAKQKETRTHRDRLQRQVQGFEGQMDRLVAAYMEWSARLNGASYEKAVASPPSLDAQGTYEVQVLDLFSELSNRQHLRLQSNHVIGTYQYYVDLLPSDHTPTSAL